MVGGTVLYPNDTIRRRLQMPGKNEATSYFGVGLALFREGGMGKLFSGLPLYWAKVAPAAGVQFGVYAGLKGWWGRRDHGP